MVVRVGHKGGSKVMVIRAGDKVIKVGHKGWVIRGHYKGSS